MMGETTRPRRSQAAPLPRLLHWICTTAARGAALAGRALGAWLRGWAVPVARRGGSAALAGAGTTGAALGRLAWRHRVVLAGLAFRGAWWASLWLTVQAALPLLGAAPLSGRDTMLMPLVYALALVGLVAMLSPERHLRRMAGILGALQGSLAALVWAAFAAAG